MPQNVLATLRKLLPTTKVFLMYGLTEAFRSTYLPPEELDRRPTSMGRAIPDCEILVLNEQGGLCKPGEVGELVHRGPTVSMGYWGRPEDTNRCLRPNPLLARELGDCERVCYSGDLVKMDEDGVLYYVGRRDTMIKSSGYRISTTEVEEALFSSGKLRHAAVIGIPDEMLGQVIKAFVVPRDGEARSDTEALVEHCLQHLPRYMIPRTVEVLAEIPKTSSGKVDYPAAAAPGGTVGDGRGGRNHRAPFSLSRRRVADRRNSSGRTCSALWHAALRVRPPTAGTQIRNTARRSAA